MSIITQAPPAVTLTLNDSNLAMFLSMGNNSQPTNPCALSIAGSSKLDHRPFDVTASGTIKTFVPGDLTVILLGLTHDYSVGQGLTNPATWVQVAATPPESIGDDPKIPETMWMLRGVDFMFSTVSGKLQGTFLSNIADSHQPVADLQNNLYGIEPNDSPALAFAIGVIFTPTGSREHRRTKDGDPLAELTLYQFSMND
jgi:hypothetical protein